MSTNTLKICTLGIKIIFPLLCGKIPNNLINRYTIIVLVLSVYVLGHTDFGVNFCPQVLLHKLPYSPYIIYHQRWNQRNVRISLASTYDLYMIFCTKVNWAIQITPLNIWNWAALSDWEKPMLGPETGLVERLLGLHVGMKWVVGGGARPISKQRIRADRGRRNNKKSRRPWRREWSQFLTISHAQLLCILSVKHCFFSWGDLNLGQPQLLHKFD